MIDYERICRVARYRARHLPSSIDWRDLAQEAALRGLMGRKSIDGPMQDFVRIEGVVGNTRHGCLRRVPMGAGPTETPREAIVMPRLQRLIEGLPTQSKFVLRSRYWGGLRNTEIASRMGVLHPSRITQIHTAAIRRLREFTH